MLRPGVATARGVAAPTCCVSTVARTAAPLELLLTQLLLLPASGVPALLLLLIRLVLLAEAMPPLMVLQPLLTILLLPLPPL